MAALPAAALQTAASPEPPAAAPASAPSAVRVFSQLSGTRVRASARLEAEGTHRTRTFRPYSSTSDLSVHSLLRINISDAAFDLRRALPLRTSVTHCSTVRESVTRSIFTARHWRAMFIPFSTASSSARLM